MNDQIQKVIDRWRNDFDEGISTKDKIRCIQVADWARGAASVLLHIDESESNRMDALNDEFWAKIEPM